MNDQGIAESKVVYSSPFFAPEHELLRDQIRRFVAKEIKPSGEACEEAGRVPRSLLRKMGELGLFGLRYPEDFGGSGLDTMATVVLAEELGRSTYSGVAITALVHTDMASVHIFNAGSDRQLERWMPKIISGEVITAIGITEHEAGSDVKGLRTTAKRQGDAYVLNGAKTFITNGVHADLYCIAARTGPGPRSSRSTSMFLVEKGTPGFIVGKPLDKHGWRSSDTAGLSFVDCVIPAENILGKEGDGFYAIMQNFQNERIVLSAMAIGEAQAALELTLDYTKLRRTFGTPLFERQAIRHRVAMLFARVEAGRQLVYATAWLHANGQDVTRQVAILKAYCGELVNEVMYDCLQFHGGYGYMRESTIERMARDARVQSIGGGATEIMLDEIAKRL